MCQVRCGRVYAKTSSNGLCPVSVLGCGHCKKAKPEFMDAAQHDADNNKARTLSSFLFGFSIPVLEN